jgi:hypothetical protein
VTFRKLYILKKKEVKRGVAPNAQKVKSLSGCAMRADNLCLFNSAVIQCARSLPKSQCIFYAVERETFPVAIVRLASTVWRSLTYINIMIY